MHFRIVLIFLLIGFEAHAQLPQNFMKELMDNIAESLPEDYDLSELEEQLTYFAKHPINLQHTSPEELKKLIFLSPLQISNFFTYMKENGKLVDVLELQGIPNFDKQTVQNLLPFVTIKNADAATEINASNLKDFGHHDLIIRYAQVLEKQKGFKNLSGSRYLGSPEKLLFRYKYTLTDRISAAVILEKDAGEYFIKGNKPLMDYQSAHLAIYRTGHFKKIIVGDYTLQFGQGLTLWSGFSFGKAPDVASMAKKDAGLKAYSSANEYSFLRGVASVLSFGSIDITPFYSFKKLDASLDLNLSNQETLSTISETGLHRTATELKNKHSLTQQIYGAALQYHNAYNFNIGLVGYRTHYNKLFVPGPQAYQTFNFTGNQLANLGLNYSYAYKNWYSFGEIAKSFPGKTALLNGLLISLSGKLSAVVVYRNYAVKYDSFLQQALAEGGDAKNEKGFYTGINLSLNKTWLLSFYADYFWFPWLKFRVDAPSQGKEILGQLAFTPTKKFKMVFRYKSETKQQNTDLDIPINFLIQLKKEAFQTDVSWQLGSRFKFQDRIELTRFKTDYHLATYGYLIYQDMAYTPILSKLSGNIRLAYFDIPSYENRIYAYEDDVLYNFSFGMYYGKGFRTIFNLKYKLAKKLDVWLRHALSYYPKVTKVGSGLDEISGPKKNETKVQLRYQF
ncbi:MAG: helix-hairpin-helix domain-containing protein [Pedobacter sp.]|nr:helix-hairpin-helix domain-containing protein [Pedobacter sp.]MDQ8052120.1 helix-hairpin-helix domain-containing protein [Pedobacter sp.]